MCWRNATSILFAIGALAATVTHAGASTAEEWPEFRGPTAQGHSSATNLPLEWSTQKNVVWKQAVPGAGWSSPVISRGQIFLTSGVPATKGGPSLHALAFDVATGRLLWNTEVFTTAESSAQAIHDKNSPASPTPIVEGDRDCSVRECHAPFQPIHHIGQCHRVVTRDDELH